MYAVAALLAGAVRCDAVVPVADLDPVWLAVSYAPDCDWLRRRNALTKVTYCIVTTATLADLNEPSAAQMVKALADAGFDMVAAQGEEEKDVSRPARRQGGQVGGPQNNELSLLIENTIRTFFYGICFF